jgi:glutamyl-tRNA reductase
MWTSFGRLISYKIMSMISVGCDFTTKSGGIWHFQQWLAAREAVPTIVALRQWAETIRLEELGKVLARIGPLEERQRRALEALSVGLVNKLFHVPTVNLKRSCHEERALDYVQLVRHLFALDP